MVARDPIVFEEQRPLHIGDVLKTMDPKDVRLYQALFLHAQAVGSGIGAVKLYTNAAEQFLGWQARLWQFLPHYALSLEYAVQQMRLGERMFSGTTLKTLTAGNKLVMELWRVIRDYVPYVENPSKVD
jgi:hypothetical protein